MGLIPSSHRLKHRKRKQQDLIERLSEGTRMNSFLLTTFNTYDHDHDQDHGREISQELKLEERVIEIASEILICYDWS